MKKEWEEEADKLQEALERFGYESCPLCGITPKYLKDHINETLIEQKQELIKKLEERRKEVDCMDVDAREKDGYNQAINDCIEAIKQM